MAVSLTVAPAFPTGNSTPVENRRVLVVDAGIESQHDLARLLPPQVRVQVTAYLLGQPRQAAALRLLAAVKSDRWYDAVSSTRIDVWQLMGCLGPYRSYENRDRVLLEAAASLADTAGVLHLPIGALTHRFLDDGDFLILLDALRIVREGLFA